MDIDAQEIIQNVEISEIKNDSEVIGGIEPLDEQTFDLRQAVIYSTILKRKYEDEDFISKS